MKTLAIKLEDGSHAQLTAIAQLEGQPVTALIKQAIEELIETKRHQPQLTDRAEAMLEEIERDAAARREALATLFGSSENAPKEPTTDKSRGVAEPMGFKPPSRSSRSKGGEPASS
ncbi:MAG: DNA-binding protein [Acidimicrobiales bacterium]